MKDILAMVVMAAVFFIMGTIMEGVWAGIIMAGAIVAVVILGKLWEQFWAKHPKMAKAGRAVCWTLGIIAGIILCIAGLPVIAPVVLIVLVIAAVIKCTPAMIRKNKQETQQFLDGFREELRRDEEAYRRKKALEEQQRKMNRAEAERLEGLARQWERNARRSGSYADAQKAQQFRDQADAAWRKVH